MLQPGDYLFAHDTTVSNDPMDDVLVGFQVDRYVLCPILALLYEGDAHLFQSCFWP